MDDFFNTLMTFDSLFFVALRGNLLSHSVA
jgi:hypothetical protein